MIYTLKVGDLVVLKQCGNTWTGKLTVNPSGSIYPCEEPKKNYDYFTYYLDGTPHVLLNDDHVIELPEVGKGYKVGKMIFWD